MSKKILLVVSFLLLVGAGCVNKNPTEGTKEAGNDNKVQVAVSIYPLAHFVQKVGGDLVEVHLITPGGVEPHDYEPTPADIVKIQSSDAFVFNGAGVDTWADSVVENRTKQGKPSLKMESLFIDEFRMMDGKLDPHIWLDPVLVKRQVKAIENLLGEIDRGNKQAYQINAQFYLAAIADLDESYQEKLAQCKLKEIIVSHDAFGYLGKRYGFTIHAIAGLSPEQEPSAARLAELTRLIRGKKITTVFFESLVSPKLAQTLANEAGAQVAVLDPIEGITDEQAQGGKNYDILMRENLTNLHKALLCQ